MRIQPQPSPNPPNPHPPRLLQQLQKLRNHPSVTKIHNISQNRIQIVIEVKKPYDHFDQIYNLVFANKEKDNADVGRSTVSFMIILHQMYPWCPPLLICLQQVMFPRLDDYRDFLEDVLEGEWWPNITAIDIINLLPKFLSKLIPHLPNQQSPIRTSLQQGKHTISASIPHTIDSILRNSKGLKLCKAEYFNTDDAIFGKYQPIILGICWTDFVVFKERDMGENGGKGFFGVRKWAVRRIGKIGSQKKGSVREGRGKGKEKVVDKYQFCLEIMGGTKEYFKIRFEAEDEQADKKEPIKQKSWSDNSLVFQQRAQNSQNLQNQKKPSLREQDSQIQINLDQHKPHQHQHPLPLQLPQHNPHRHLQTLRHIIQYIQLREWVLGREQNFQTRTRMLSQIIENSSELEDQPQVHMYYQSKLKQAIYNEYINNQSQTLSNKFWLDI